MAEDAARRDADAGSIAARPPEGARRSVFELKRWVVSGNFMRGEEKFVGGQCWY